MKNACDRTIITRLVLASGVSIMHVTMAIRKATPPPHMTIIPRRGENNNNINIFRIGNYKGTESQDNKDPNEECPCTREW